MMNFSLSSYKAHFLAIGKWINRSVAFQFYPLLVHLRFVAKQPSAFHWQILWVLYKPLKSHLMSNTDNILKNPEEEEENKVTEEETATDLQLKPDGALTETVEVLSETKVRHDTVK